MIAVDRSYADPGQGAVASYRLSRSCRGCWSAHRTWIRAIAVALSMLLAPAPGQGQDQGQGPDILGVSSETGSGQQTSGALVPQVTMTPLLKALEGVKEPTPGLLLPIELTDDELRAIIESQSAIQWRTARNLSDEERAKADASLSQLGDAVRYPAYARALNHKNAKFVLIARTRSFQAYVDALYGFVRQMNPVHYIPETLVAIALGREPIMGRKIDRGTTALQLVLYVTLLKGQQWVSGQVAKLRPVPPVVTPATSSIRSLVRGQLTVGTPRHLAAVRDAAGWTNAQLARAGVPVKLEKSVKFRAFDDLGSPKAMEGFEFTIAGKVPSAKAGNNQPVPFTSSDGAPTPLLADGQIVIRVHSPINKGGLSPDANAARGWTMVVENARGTRWLVDGIWYPKSSASAAVANAAHIPVSCPYLAVP